MTPDWLLLRRYARENSQEAFAVLTERYLGLVYSVCLREVHDTEQAQDVTQAVFLLLARTAPSFRSRTALPSWLFRTARFASQNARTRELRRRKYEKKAAMEMHPQARTENAAWEDIEPTLNQSLAALGEAERDCILLRFFQGLTFAETGEALGLSEEAARKRVTRALEKMRRFFGKSGVVVPCTALALLLTTHTAEAAPMSCGPAIAHLTTNLLAGHASAAVTASHAYQLSEGLVKAMKIAKLKMISGSAALLLVGGGVSYGILRGQAPDQKTLYRTVLLTGKAHYADGKPAGGVRIDAQLQNAASLKMMETEKPGLLSNRARQLSETMGSTRADGTYTLAVGADLPYNVMLLPNNLLQAGQDDGWVAAAAEGVSSHKNQKIVVPDLILTRGAFAVGTVTDKASGKPLDGVNIGSYGPARPSSGGGIIGGVTDDRGHYRLRLAPGKNQLYVADDRYTEGDTESGTFVTIAAGQTQTANFRVTPK